MALSQNARTILDELAHRTSGQDHPIEVALLQQEHREMGEVALHKAIEELWFLKYVISPGPDLKPVTPASPSPTRPDPFQVDQGRLRNSQVVTYIRFFKRVRLTDKGYAAAFSGET
jgi:hypothetical protein